MRAMMTVLRLSLVVGITGVAASAMAAQYENMNGNGCNSLYPSDFTAGGTSYGTLMFHESTSLRNGSSSFRYATCPIRRVLATSTGGWFSYVVATDSTNQLWCSAASLDEYGNTVASSPVTTIPAGGGAQLISLPFQATAVWGYFNIFCAMPSGSSIQQTIHVEY